MKVLALSGSPRKNGNTGQYLNIKGCYGCYDCVQAKKCGHPDNFRMAFDKIVEANVLLPGSL